MVRICQPGLHLLCSITMVIEGPKLHSLVFTAREEVVLSCQWRETLYGARVTQEALQSDLVEVEMWILLVESDLVLPVSQPVALQGAAAARELLLQGTILRGGACHPGGRSERCTDGWSEGGGSGVDGSGMAVVGAHPGGDGAHVRATTIIRVPGHLDAVPYQMAPKGA